MDEAIETVLDIIAEKKDLPTICEGKRDVIALRKLGFTHIIELDGPLYKVVERFEKKSRVQILTDLDAEGKKLYSMLAHDLKQRGVHVDNELRDALFQTDLRQIEGLTTFLGN